ncbi:hypothetical protein PIROE2DRAFT_62136 [Piromyces sp. E2]|nr:hypothetical protein PIROE2DRAFT_62136 [Piromyces sp. E2]|eukprot:OUM62049.1 hypothetical protein PIROE2DRAFT_62136 [Piromyces sp. E2]
MCIKFVVYFINSKNPSEYITYTRKDLEELKNIIENDNVTIGIYIRNYNINNQINKKSNTQITSSVTSIQKIDNNDENSNKRSLLEESENFNDQDNKKLKVFEEDDLNNIKRDEMVVALYDFKGNTSHKINFNKGEKLRVIDWKAKQGWVYGYSVYSPQRKGFFPKILVGLCREDIYKDGDLVVALYNFKGNNIHELDIKKNDKIIVLDWYAKEGWVYGYIHNQNSNIIKKGLIPKLFIELIQIEEKVKDQSIKEVKNEEHVIALYDFISKNPEELTIYKNEKLKVLDWKIKED